MAVVTFDDTLANGQADAGAGNHCAMQPLEDPKDFLVIFGRDTDAVISHGKAPQSIDAGGGDVDARRFISPVLDAI